jgi:small-conductance mechanosensitive channel
MRRIGRGVKARHRRPVQFPRGSARILVKLRSVARPGEEPALLPRAPADARAGAGAIFRLVLLAMLLAAGSWALPAVAAEKAPLPVEATDATPVQVQQLLKLLADPAVQAWIARHQTAAGPGAAATAPTSPPAGSAQMMGMGGAMGMQEQLSDRLTGIRDHLRALAAAVPQLPASFAHAHGMIMDSRAGNGLGRVLMLVVLFVAMGFLVERVFWRISAGLRERIIHSSVASVRDRLIAAVMRLGFGTTWVLAFAIGSVGTFLLFPWPTLLRELVLGYLIAFLIIRMAYVVTRFLFSPGAERFRLVPMSTVRARMWTRGLELFVGWFAFGWITIGALGLLGFPGEARLLVAYAMGLVLLAVALWMIWRSHAIRTAETPAAPRFGKLRPVLLSVMAVIMWGLWVASTMRLFWLLAVVLALPPLLGATHRLVRHLLRPAEDGTGVESAPSVLMAATERGARALLIIGAAFELAWAWGIDLGQITGGDTVAMRLLSGALNAVIILLIADFAWHLLRAFIDRQLATAEGEHHGEGAEASRRARLRTLLPILRNIAFVVLLVMAALMVLSSLGVQIGPLLAGAGVVGVAIGFGAQTLVKDVISGMFFLLDDAFRVGEYIMSGSVKGTVESFSLRSVKLRHHRGPLFTVPFGSLGAIQNLSRDWVIDKLMVNVPFDTDLDKVKKIIKQLSSELTADPELAPVILQPLKSQGVAAMGDFAIQIRMKIMTKPGEQFVVRRVIYDKLKKKFAENGIKFAVPTVNVAGGDASAATTAVAQQAIELTRPQPQAAE